MPETGFLSVINSCALFVTNKISHTLRTGVLRFHKPTDAANAAATFPVQTIRVNTFCTVHTCAHAFWFGDLSVLNKIPEKLNIRCLQDFSDSRLGTVPDKLIWIAVESLHFHLMHETPARVTSATMTQG